MRPNSKDLRQVIEKLGYKVVGKARLVGPGAFRRPLTVRPGNDRSDDAGMTGTNCAANKGNRPKYRYPLLGLQRGDQTEWRRGIWNQRVSAEAVASPRLLRVRSAGFWMREGQGIDGENQGAGEEPCRDAGSGCGLRVRVAGHESSPDKTVGAAFSRDCVPKLRNASGVQLVATATHILRHGTPSRLQAAPTGRLRVCGIKRIHQDGPSPTLCRPGEKKHTAGNPARTLTYIWVVKDEMKKYCSVPCTGGRR